MANNEFRPKGKLKAADTTPKSLMQDIAQFFGAEGHRTNKIIEGILGTADFTPLGALQSAYDLPGSIRRGDFSGAAMDAVGMIPGIGPAKKLAPGEDLKTMMLAGGKNPAYGIVDKADNSVPTIFSGGLGSNGNNMHTLVQNALPNPRQVKDLIGRPKSQGGINEQQAKDAITGPKLHPQSELLDQLLLRGLKPGDSLKSGTLFGKGPKMLEMMGQAALTKPLKNTTGNFTGGRVTGAKSQHGGPPAEISIPKVRAKAEKKGLRPAEDRSLGVESTSDLFNGPASANYGELPDPAGAAMLRAITSKKREQRLGELEFEGPGKVEQTANRKIYNKNEAATTRRNEANRVLRRDQGDEGPDPWDYVDDDDSALHGLSDNVAPRHIASVRQDYGHFERMPDDAAQDVIDSYSNGFGNGLNGEGDRLLEEIKHRLRSGNATQADIQLFDELSDIDDVIPF